MIYCKNVTKILYLFDLLHIYIAISDSINWMGNYQTHTDCWLRCSISLFDVSIIPLVWAHMQNNMQNTNVHIAAIHLVVVLPSLVR